MSHFLRFAAFAMGQEESLRDITGIEKQAIEPAGSLIPWLLPAGVIVLAAVAGFSLGRILRRVREPLTPEAWARHELARIERLHLADKGDPAKHYFLISNVVRGYVEKCFDLPARRRTTEEFLQVVANDPRLPEPQKTLLREFLVHCDLGKFSGAEHSHDGCRALISQALKFIETTSVGITDTRQ